VLTIVAVVAQPALEKFLELKETGVTGWTALALAALAGVYAWVRSSRKNAEAAAKAVVDAATIHASTPEERAAAIALAAELK